MLERVPLWAVVVGGVRLGKCLGLGLWTSPNSMQETMPRRRASRKSGSRVLVGSFVPVTKDCVPAKNLLPRLVILTPTLGRHVGRHENIYTLQVVLLHQSLRFPIQELKRLSLVFGRGGNTHLHHHSSFLTKPPYTPWQPFRSYILSPTRPH